MRALLLVNAMVDERLLQGLSAGDGPRRDFLELQRVLQADVLDRGAVDARRWGRLAQRWFGFAAAQALMAWRRSARYEVIFVDRESAGILLAALLRLRTRRPRLLMIGHLLSAPKKQRLFRLLRLQRAMEQMIVHATVQRQVAVDGLGMHEDRVTLIPYHTDQRFWRQTPQEPARQICSAGLEYRDYRTLLAAVTGLDIQVRIAAASHWSTHPGIEGITLPPNVQVASYDYQDLRRLYSASLFVVVPLHDVDNQAGITTILEAMSMGKAVIVSHTRGQTDVVRDRRSLDRTAPQRSTQPAWASSLGATSEAAEGQTGFYVRPGDVDELRRAIDYLLAHPEQGAADGRQRAPLGGGR